MKPDLQYRIIIGLIAIFILTYVRDSLFAFSFAYFSLLWIWLIYLTRTSIRFNKSKNNSSIGRYGTSLGIIGLTSTFITIMSMFSFFTRMIFGGFYLYTIMPILVLVLFLTSIGFMFYYLMDKLEVKNIKKFKNSILISLIILPLGLVTIHIPSRKREKEHPPNIT
jgi:hypothetical protein